MFGNLDMIFKLKKAWSTFSANHPGVAGFIGQAGKRGIGEGTVIDLKFAYPDGTHLETNMKVKPEDIELMQMLKELADKNKK